MALRCLVVAAATFLALAVPTWASEHPPATGKKTIVFVCLHGVVNSQMAAAYFNKALDGLNPANPLAALTASDASGASKVLAFDTVPAELSAQTSVTYWSGVALGVNDYKAARDDIVRRIDDLIPKLR